MRTLAPQLGFSVLTNLMTDSNRRVRDAAACALLYVENSSKGVNIIRQALSSSKSEVREAALLAFAENGPVLPSAYPAIVKCAEDPDPEIRRRAAIALATYNAFGLGDKNLRGIVAPALAKLLHDCDSNVVYAASNLLQFSNPGQKFLSEAQDQK